jgi:vacuolar protein sorting-associated protein 26
VYLHRNYNNKIDKEQNFAVQILTPEMDSVPPVPIKVEVGVDNFLHIEFEYVKTRYHFKDCIVAKVFFHLVKLRIR